MHVHNNVFKIFNDFSQYKLYIYTKLTLKYFRREINRGRAAGSEVPAVVCIHSGEACVHI